MLLSRARGGELRGCLPGAGVALALSSLAAGAFAQCELHWKAGHPAPGPAGNSGFVTSVTWDPDGSGPRLPVVVFGGTFTMPSIGAQNLVQWDPRSGVWSAFAGQPDRAVAEVDVLPDGALVVVGSFVTVGALPARGIAVFDGTQWTSPGGGVAMAAPGAQVRAVEPLADGSFVIGGNFTAAGGVAAEGLARWDGTQWHALSGFRGDARQLVRRGNALVVGGQFPVVGGSVPIHVAEWDAGTWRYFGSGIQGGYSYVTGLAVLDNGDVVVSGFFNSVGGTTVGPVARWDGSQWQPMGSGFDGRLTNFLVLPGGALLGAHVLVVGGVPVSGVGLWNGSSWVPYATGVGIVTRMQYVDGRLLLLGALQSPSGPLGAGFWEGGELRPLSDGLDATVVGSVALPDGEAVVFGDFQRAGGDVRWLARTEGERLRPFQSASAPLPLIASAVCGTVDQAGSLWLANASTVARWTGSNWVQVGSGQSYVSSLLVPPDGLPIVGRFMQGSPGQSVMRWSGFGWQQIGESLDGDVLTVLRRRSGELVVGGSFLFAWNTPVSRIARWDGVAWRPLGPGLDGTVRALAELPNGDLVAAGDFTSDGLVPLHNVARWDGAAWRPLGAGLLGSVGASARALLVLPDGDLLLGGSFTHASGRRASGVVRFDGSEWLPFAGGVDGTVRTLALLRDGDVLAGGDFATAGGRQSAHLARLRSPCAASQHRRGSGCAGAFGVLSLEGDTAPWVGGVHRATCYAVPPGALAAVVTGTRTSSLPLVSLHPAAGASCTLLVQADAATWLVAQSGIAAVSLTVPPVPALVGVTLHEQVLTAEFGPSGSLARIAASNALELVIGVL